MDPGSCNSRSSGADDYERKIKMSKAQYNLKTKTDYLQRKMFLDPAGPVTIQRFEEVKYNKLQKFEQEARGFFWVPEEVSLTKDSQDF